ncbi:ankyrin repeat-containing domain protein [Phaeosphaeria sp. MPI-PUGE-AT-0046c]|nr:ankyrin repeat-containing domain protein [Phaeosphaeria sp. MPI-PUGE-AT-0046c]
MMIDVSRRLRRAILLNDLPLVQRIIRNNPQKLRNPDFEDKSNTSLHLAARNGFTGIAEFLIECGHEDEMVSRNNDLETPLMLAAANGKEDTGVMLAKRFAGCICWQDKGGLDALMLACKSGAGTTHLIPTLILLSPTPPSSTASNTLSSTPTSILTNTDVAGNTALHHASAAGELKALRMLLTYGANPLASNSFSWTPVHYSATSAAETYFKTLIIDSEKKKAEGRRVEKERERARLAGVRLVTDQEESQSAGSAGSGSQSTQRARDDQAIAMGLPAPGVEWSPVERRRAMTPTEGRGWTFTPDGMRPRAETGESI